MRIIPIKEIQRMDDKEQIRAASGTLVKVYETNRGRNESGEWSIQSLTLKDATGEIPVKILNHLDDEIPKNWRGRKVIIESHDGPKGISGVYAFDDDYNNKITRKIKVTATGKIYLDEPDAGSASDVASGERDTRRNSRDDEGDPSAERARGSVSRPERNQHPPSSNREQSRVTRQGNGPAPAQRAASDEPPTETAEEKEARQDRGVKDAKIALARLANLYCLAIDVVGKVVAPHYQAVTGSAVTEDGFNGFVTGLVIRVERRAMDANLPVKPLTPPESPSKTSPAPALASGPPPQRPSTPPDDDEIPF